MTRCDRCGEVITGMVVFVDGSWTIDVVCKPCWDGFVEFFAENYPDVEMLE